MEQIITEKETTQTENENIPITLNLDLNTVNFILASLGETKSSSGAWLLIQKIKEQGESQLIPHATIIEDIIV
jgi:hypothetical protein